MQPPRPPPARLTHFLCIPLLTPHTRPQLAASLSSFRSDVLGTDTNNDTKTTTHSRDSTIPEDAIRPLGTMHLTLGVMSLLTPQRVQGAVELLRGLDLAALLRTAVAGGVKSGVSPVTGKDTTESEVEDPGPDDGAPHPGGKKVLEASAISLSLRGLSSMHHPSNTSVLYAAPHDPSRSLQLFAEAVRAAFVGAGYVVPETRPLLLHATVVNTVYVKPKPGFGGGRGRKRAKVMLNVEEIVRRYAEVVWMEGLVERVGVWRMGAKVGEGGEEEYGVEAEVDVNGMSY